MLCCRNHLSPWHDPRKSPQIVTKSLEHRSPLLLLSLAPPHHLSTCPTQSCDAGCLCFLSSCCFALLPLLCVTPNTPNVNFFLTGVLLESSYLNRNIPEACKARTTKPFTSIYRYPMKGTSWHRLDTQHQAISQKSIVHEKMLETSMTKFFRCIMKGDIHSPKRFLKTKLEENIIHSYYSINKDDNYNKEKQISKYLSQLGFCCCEEIP